MMNRKKCPNCGSGRTYKFDSSKELDNFEVVRECMECIQKFTNVFVLDEKIGHKYE